METSSGGSKLATTESIWGAQLEHRHCAATRGTLIRRLRRGTQIKPSSSAYICIICGLVFFALRSTPCRNVARHVRTCTPTVLQCDILGAHVHTHRVAMQHPRCARAHPPCGNATPSVRMCTPTVSHCNIIGAHVHTHRVATQHHRCARAHPPCRNATSSVRTCTPTVSRRDEMREVIAANPLKTGRNGI
jgi:hypothetical protein